MQLRAINRGHDAFGADGVAVADLQVGRRRRHRRAGGICRPRGDRHRGRGRWGRRARGTGRGWDDRVVVAVVDVLVVRRTGRGEIGPDGSRAAGGVAATDDRRPAATAVAAATTARRSCWVDMSASFLRSAAVTSARFRRVDRPRRCTYMPVDQLCRIVTAPSADRCDPFNPFVHQPFTTSCHSRGSTGSDSMASTAKTASCTRHSGSPAACRSSASSPSAYSRSASDCLCPRLRWRSRSRLAGSV